MTAAKNDTEAVRELFGTDGIRGRANEEPMTPETILRLGRAAGHYFLTSKHRRHRVVIGKDTRLSGYMFETALSAGLCSVGVDVLLVGPMPTPGIALLARTLRADAGIAISASHNPYQDNGIKFFGPDGFKLPDSAEARIETLVLGDEIDHLRSTGEGIGKAFRIDDADGRYNAYLKNVIPRDMDFEGLRLVVDCAHGAAHRIAPAVLEELGAEVIAIGIEPNGTNINDGVGALHVDNVAAEVKRIGADAGIALDGDADRVILVDENGDEVDGDHVLAILALAMKEAGDVPGNAIVGTIMSNFGLEVLLREHDLELIRTPVGDRYVVERMRRDGYVLGGEKSGHVVSLEHGTTGDGMVTALRVLSVVKESGKKLSELRSVMKSYPQVLTSLPVREKPDLNTITAVSSAIASAEAALGDNGRVVVRYSGTEPVARVMVEGTDADAVDHHAHAITEAIRAALG
ncbi:MAG: phosphoglucosamine mutase [Planctomycetota bacterium]|jgi:phosphoglucosamine mutase